MGLYSSFYSSLSGLSSNANALSVIGNNLSNLNTIGYKGSSASFQDLFSASVGATSTQGNGNPIQIGLGTQLGAISQNFGQGSFQSTSNVTDMALQGQGFFTLQTKDGGAGYTRAGNFTVDKTGFLVDPNGNNVKGWNRIGNTLTANGLSTPVHLDMGTTSPPASTASLGTVTNLDGGAATGTVYSTPVQVYDSLGASHSLLFTYTKDPAVGTWNLDVSTDGVFPDGTKTAVTGFPAQVVFGNNGLMTTPDPAAANPTLTFGLWPNGASTGAAGNVAWNLVSNGTSTLTGYSAASATSSTSQDGYGAGTVRSMTVNQDGIIIGNFTNGQTIPMAQVAISSFANSSGLAKQGENMWGETLASGQAAVGAANQGGRGTVLGANLELSNVDVAEEFTRLIINQRGYQANSRVVTTADSLLQETLNLVR
jgi:flagellar hook protein FlgE